MATCHTFRRGLHGDLSTRFALGRRPVPRRTREEYAPTAPRGSVNFLFGSDKFLVLVREVHADLGVLKCCGAFTSLDGLVAISR